MTAQQRAAARDMLRHTKLLAPGLQLGALVDATLYEAHDLVKLLLGHLRDALNPSSFLCQVDRIFGQSLEDTLAA